MFEFWKNKWQLFLDDLSSIKSGFLKIFGVKKDENLMLGASLDEFENQEQVQNSEMPEMMPVEQAVSDMPQQQTQETLADVMPQVKYEEDAIDNKVSAYFGEDINSLRENVSGEKTQHEVLREYAQYFKPYNSEYEMCNSAFQKYYDRHALKIATNEIPVQQLRIVQNNVDIFISGQEVFGENGQFIDSRVDSIFEKIGAEQMNKMVNILHDSDGSEVNVQGERLFAESIHYMVDNGIKLDKDGDIVKPIKTVLEDKLNDVHNSLRNHEDWNEEYQQLLSDERKYLYALNRIEQYETEQRISEFEQKLSELDTIAE